MIYDWAKVWTDILGDPKLMRAARKGAKGLELTPWFITFAKEADDDGRLTIGGEAAEAIDFVPLIPGQSVRSITTALRSLEALKVLVRDPDGVLRFAAWEIRQERAPSDLPEARRDRVRQHRERRRAAERNGEAVTDVTEEAVTGVTGVTGRSVTTRRGEESERETKSTPPPSPPGGTLRDRLPEECREDLDALLSRVPNPTAWIGEMQMAVEGGTAGGAISYADLGRAIHDFRLNGKAETPEIVLLRAYIRRASGERRRPERAGPPRARPPTPPTTPLRRLV